MPSSPKIPRERIIKIAANLVRFIAAQPKGDFRGEPLISGKRPGCSGDGLGRRNAFGTFDGRPRYLEWRSIWAMGLST